ncbi:MAG TPA: HAMP domain-containing sensor histidine kinase [Thermoanaerobaculia bacterium]|jgi:signal transduction histidine kinase|nr:HAMP domain-containing sensor histidine kinase [Thermoanaerobaculia bacterium]
MASDHPNQRRALVALLLCASLASAVVLALQVQNAVRDHRNATQGVLRDDAMLAAEEFIRRSAVEVGYEGVYQQLLHLDEAPATGAGGLVGPMIGDDGGKLRVGGSEPEPATAVLLGKELAAAPPAKRPFRLVHAVLDGRPRSFVILSKPLLGKTGSAIRGFELRLAELQGSFHNALEKGPLLPPFLAKGGRPPTNDFFGLRVRDQAGVVRFAVGPQPPAGIAVSKPFGDAYERMLQGFVLDLSVDPGAASQLVSGGLPRSRLPGLLLLLGLSAGFTVTAILQLRRESALLRLREEFIASVSHELRTPLTQIRVFAETLLLSRARSEEEEERSLRIIDREARRLSQLVENVLLFSRTSRGVLTVSPEVFRLAPLVREVLEGFSPIAEARQVRFRTELDGETAALADPHAVRQVLLNVLDNAVKYGPSGQEIRVAVSSVNGGARIAVADEGPGIDPADRERVFARFERLPRERASAVAGAGIGLAVVRDLVARMRGRCFLEASDLSEGGLRFVLELPGTGAAS